LTGGEVGAGGVDGFWKRMRIGKPIAIPTKNINPSFANISAKLFFILSVPNN
jgi:hypothetical protein